MMLVHLSVLVILMQVAILTQGRSLRQRGKRLVYHTTEPNEYPVQNDYYYPQIDGRPIYIPSMGQSAEDMKELLDYYYNRNEAFTSEWTPDPPVKYNYDNIKDDYYEDSMSNDLETDAFEDHHGNVHILPGTKQSILSPTVNHKKYLEYEDEFLDGDLAVHTPEVYIPEVRKTITNLQKSTHKPKFPYTNSMLEYAGEKETDTDEYYTPEIYKKFSKEVVGKDVDLKKMESEIEYADEKSKDIEEYDLPEIVAKKNIKLKNYMLQKAKPELSHSNKEETNSDEYHTPEKLASINIKKGNDIANQKDDYFLEDLDDKYERPSVHKVVKKEKVNEDNLYTKNESGLTADVSDDYYEQPIIIKSSNKDKIKPNKHLNKGKRKKHSISKRYGIYTENTLQAITKKDAVFEDLEYLKSQHESISVNDETTKSYLQHASGNRMENYGIKETPINSKKIVETDPKEKSEKVEKEEEKQEKVVIKTEPRETQEKVVIKTEPRETQEKVVIKTEPRETQEKVVIKTEPRENSEVEYETKNLQLKEIADNEGTQKVSQGSNDISNSDFRESIGVGISPDFEHSNNPKEALGIDGSESDFENIGSGENQNTQRLFPNVNSFNRLSSLNSNIWSLLFNPNAKNNKLKKCETRSNETGYCTYIQNCDVPNIATTLEELLLNACVMDEVFIGICCPEFPVETVKVQWEHTSNSDIQTKDEFVHSSHDCGIRSNEASKLQSWPWKAPLVSMSNGKIFCGGVVISEEYILTAAHCTTKIPRNQILVRLGQYNESTGDDFAVVEIKRHAQYDSRTMHHDIALLKLGRRITIDDFTSLVCLPEEDEDDEHDGEKALLLGWRGMFGTKAESEALEIIDNEECKKKLRMNISSAVLCTEARDEDERTCNADSGAPLVIEDDHKYEVIGILSWNRNDCDQRFPATFSKISKYVEWIKKHAV